MSNDDGIVLLGGEGSVPYRKGTSTSRDSYLKYVFGEPGTYFIEVDGIDLVEDTKRSVGIPDGGTYTLQVSLETPNVTGSVVETTANSGMFARASGAGAAGNITVNAPQLTISDGAQISAETIAGEGNITLNTSNLQLRGNSAIITDATQAASGGNITIDTNTLVLENSNITARAVGGQGGNIQITAQGIFQDNVSNIDASSQRGVDGTVEIQTQVDPARGLISLAQTPIDASSLISKGCEEYRGSEFIITGRGGIPPHPFETLPGEVIWLDWRSLTDENSSLGYSVPSETFSSSEVVTPEEGELPDDEIRQAQGWLPLPDGTVVLTAYPVKMTPAGPLMQHPGCQIILGDSEQ